MIDIKQAVEEESRNAGITLHEQQLQQVVRYLEMLSRWGRKVNLTSNPSPDVVIGRQLPDAFHLYKHVMNQPEMAIQRFMDVGSGAGLPGLVFALLVPGLETTLVESNNKKCSFLRSVIHSANRENISVVSKRIESIMPQSVHMASSRATWEPSLWLQHAERLVSNNGWAVTFSSAEVDVGRHTDFTFHSSLRYQLSDGTPRMQTFYQMKRSDH